MLNNEVVNQAVKDRNNLTKDYGGGLKIDVAKNICWLVIYPRNSIFTESPLGHWAYSYDKLGVNRVWIVYG